MRQTNPNSRVYPLISGVWRVLVSTSSANLVKIDTNYQSQESYIWDFLLSFLQVHTARKAAEYLHIPTLTWHRWSRKEGLAPNESHSEIPVPCARKKKNQSNNGSDWPANPFSAPVHPSQTICWLITTPWMGWRSTWTPVSSTNLEVERTVHAILFSAKYRSQILTLSQSNNAQSVPTFVWYRWADLRADALKRFADAEKAKAAETLSRWKIRHFRWKFPN